MKSITMTEEQTSVYDEGDEEAQRNLMAELMAIARVMSGDSYDTVEIYTADGIVAAVAQ